MIDLIQEISFVFPLFGMLLAMLFNRYYKELKLLEHKHEKEIEKMEYIKDYNELWEKNKRQISETERQYRELEFIERTTVRKSCTYERESPKDELTNDDIREWARKQLEAEHYQRLGLRAPNRDIREYLGTEEPTQIIIAEVTLGPSHYTGSITEEGRKKYWMYDEHDPSGVSIIEGNVFRLECTSKEDAYTHLQDVDIESIKFIK